MTGQNNEDIRKTGQEMNIIRQGRAEYDTKEEDTTRTGQKGENDMNTTRR